MDCACWPELEVRGGMKLGEEGVAEEEEEAMMKTGVKGQEGRALYWGVLPCVGCGGRGYCLSQVPGLSRGRPWPALTGCPDWSKMELLESNPAAGYASVSSTDVPTS